MTTEPAQAQAEHQEEADRAMDIIPDFPLNEKTEAQAHSPLPWTPLFKLDDNWTE